MPTVNTGMQANASVAQPSGISYGREDTWFASEMAELEAWRNPALFAIQKAGTERFDSEDAHWFNDEYQPYTDQINYGTNYSSSATGLVVDNASRFKVGHIVRDDTSREVMLVTSVGSTYIGVVRDFGQSTEGWAARADTVYDNGYVSIIGSAYESGHPWPTIQNTLEVEYTNYRQDHRTSLGVTETLDVTAMRAGGNEMARQQRKKTLEHMCDIDRAFFDGRPYRGDKGAFVTATGNTAPSMAGGLDHYLTAYGVAATKVDETELTEFEFLDWIEAVFDKGSKKKWLFCASALRTAIMKWNLTREFVTETTNVAGLDIDKIRTSDGTLYLATHDHLKRNLSTDYQRAYAVDMNNCKYLNFGPDGTTRYRQGDPYAATGATLKEAELQTQFSFRFTNFATHGRLRWKTIAV